MSASARGRPVDDLVPGMQRTDDLTAAKESLHLSQAITTEYGFLSLTASISASLL